MRSKWFRIWTQSLRPAATAKKTPRPGCEFAHFLYRLVKFIRKNAALQDCEFRENPVRASSLVRRALVLGHLPATGSPERSASAPRDAKGTPGICGLRALPALPPEPIFAGFFGTLRLQSRACVGTLSARAGHPSLSARLRLSRALRHPRGNRDEHPADDAFRA